MMDTMMTPWQDDVEILEESYPVRYSEVGVRPFMNLRERIRYKNNSFSGKFSYNHILSTLIFKITPNYMAAIYVVSKTSSVQHVNKDNFATFTFRLTGKGPFNCYISLKRGEMTF